MPSMEMDVERLYKLLDLAARRREAIVDARDWLLDVFGDEDDQAEIRTLNALRIVQSIETHYEGGFKQFLRDGFNIVENEADGWH